MPNWLENKALGLGGRWAGYSLAAAATALALLVHGLAAPWMGDLSQFTMFYFAVAATAALAGWRAGLAASLLGAAAGVLLFVGPAGPYRPREAGSHLVEVLLYLAVCGAIVALAEWARRQRLEARRRALDVTEATRADKALQDSESFYRQTLESIPGMVFTTRPDGYCDYQSRQWVEYTGVPMSEHVGDGWNNLLHPDDRPRACAAWRAAVEERAPYDLEYRVRRHDGQYKWFKVIGRPIRDRAGQIVRWFGTAINVEDLKRAEEALRESEQRVRLKLASILSPEDDLGMLDLADLLDVEEVQSMMDDFCRLARIPMAIVDRRGKVVVGAGWQKVCVDFHRVHPETCKHCIESDTELSAEAAEGQCRLYKCKNNMWNIATPLMVGAQRVGHIFAGQFFFDDERLDLELFRSQARQYSFDEQQYLAAIAAVPRLSREVVNTGMAFLMKLGRMLSELSYGNVKLARSLAQREVIENELRAAQHSAEQAKAAAEQANRTKDHFLAVLSHELRTPLTPVVMGVSLLQDRRDLDPAVRETLEMIRRNVEMEARLIDDLLDVTRIVRGKLELSRTPVELCTVIHRAVEVCRPDIEARRLHFRLDLGPAAPYWIEADVPRLQQVFWNLLKNAVKFTPHGGRIEIRCRPDDNHVLVDVSDSGIGIEPAALPRVFNAFEQVDVSITRQFGGLGLGLAISKVLVDMHGGRIEAHSEGRDQGATFRIRLPLCTPQAAPEGPARSAPSTPAARPLRILLVEDHGVTAKMMGMVLSADGHSVETAADVATALELAGQQPFDLLVSDLGLPDGSGHDLLRELRSRGHTFPAVAMSGYGQDEDIRRSCESGFASHLTKPATREQLVEVVASAAAGRPPADAAPAAAHAPDRQSPPAHARSFDLKEAIRLCAGDQEVFESMVECFFDEADRVVQELQSTLAANDAPAVARAAHRFKGTVAYLGAQAATNTVNHLEHAALSADLSSARSASEELAVHVERLKHDLLPYRQTGRPGRA